MLTNFDRCLVEPDSSEYKFVSQRFYDSFKHLNVAPPLSAPVPRSGPPLGPVARPPIYPPSLPLPPGQRYPPAPSASLVPLANAAVSSTTRFPLNFSAINNSLTAPAPTLAHSQNPPSNPYSSGLPLPPTPMAPSYILPTAQPRALPPATMNPTPTNASNLNMFYFPLPTSSALPVGPPTQPQPPPPHPSLPSLSNAHLFGPSNPSFGPPATSHRHRRALASNSTRSIGLSAARPGRNNTMPQIQSVERIQNQRWFKQYKAHEHEFKQKLGKQTQEWLFHGERIDRSRPRGLGSKLVHLGCNEQASKNIEMECFNRSYAGQHGKSMLERLSS